MPANAHAFILYAIDDDLLYPCLGARFETGDLDKLGCLLSIDKEKDPLIDMQYTLAPSETALLCEAFSIPFDSGARIVTLHKDDDKVWNRAPYLFHTGYELPLLLQGRKKLAFMHFYNRDDRSQILKARFDHYVAAGVLHAEEEQYGALNTPDYRFLTVYYTPMGEEWRIPALMLLRRNSGTAGGWSEVHERLEGSLMGYEDWQNDWWLEQHASGDGILYGMSFRCAVTKRGLDWIEYSGYRALPPMDGPNFTAHSSFDLDNDTMRLTLQDEPDIAAFVQFNIAGRHLMHVIDFREGGPYELPTARIPEINRKLTRPIHVVARRDGS